MTTNGDDYEPLAGAAALYRAATAAEYRARIWRTVAAALRQVARLRSGIWPREQARSLEREAELARRYARQLRARAERLTRRQQWQVWLWHGEK